MLEGIKTLINSKIALQESAAMILEDSMDTDLDDLIVLGEDGEDPEVPMEEESDEPEENETPEDGEPEPSETPAEDNTDPETPSEDEGYPEDFMNTELDTLPTPVGAQTGEPVKDDVEDFLNVELDLRTNTLSDVVPTPPVNSVDVVEPTSEPSAHSAVPGAEPVQPTQPIDAGEEAAEPSEGSTELPGDDGTPSMEESTITERFREVYDGEKIPEGLTRDQYQAIRRQYQNLVTAAADARVGTDASKAAWKKVDDFKAKYPFLESVEAMGEGISLAGGMGNDDPAPATDSTGDPAPADDPSAVDTTAPEGSEGDPAPDNENTVTAAVRDKVNESETDTEGGSTAAISKEELLKKLGNITKNLEDAKKAVMDSIK